MATTTSTNFAITAMPTGQTCAYTYDYSSVLLCLSTWETNYPTCYGYFYTDGPCCTSYLDVEYNYLNCLSTAYGQNCFDYSYYSLYLSDYPCYSNVPNRLTAPSAVSASTTPVPVLSLVSVSYAVVTTTSPHAPVSVSPAAASLLQGYCATPDYVLLDGPTAYWAPVVGCANGKSDCCPFSVASPTAVTTTTETAPAYAGLQGYPMAQSPSQATLAQCPSDYISISSGCCPSGYKLWNVNLGGQIPCYSSLGSPESPPPIPVTTNQAAPSITGNPSSFPSTISIPDNGKATSAIINVVYAIQYPVQPQNNALSTGAKAGIGAGAGIASIAIAALVFLLIRSIRKNKKMKSEITSPQGNTQNPLMVQSNNGVSSISSPYANSNRTELQTDGFQPSVQAPGGFVQQPQGTYFPVQQTLGQGQYGPGQYPHQNTTQAQSAVSYPSPPLSTVSPAPPSDSGYSYQTGYGSQGHMHQVSSYSGSQDPHASYAGGIAPQQIPQQFGQQGYQMGYAAPAPISQQPQLPENHSELEGYQSAGFMSVSSQEQVQTIEQRSGQEQEYTQNFGAQELSSSSGVDLESAAAPQSPSSVSRRPLPQQSSDAQELSSADTRQ